MFAQASQSVYSRVYFLYDTHTHLRYFIWFNIGKVSKIGSTHSFLGRVRFRTLVVVNVGMRKLVVLMVCMRLPSLTVVLRDSGEAVARSMDRIAVRRAGMRVVTNSIVFFKT